MEKNKHAIRQAVKDFQRHPGDTGSCEVQIAILSERIKYMTSHVQVSRTARTLSVSPHGRCETSRHLSQQGFLSVRPTQNPIRRCIGRTGTTIGG